MNDSAAPPIHLIILAGGLSSRARGSDSAAPKQFRTVGDTMLLMFSVRELLQVANVATLTITVPDPWQALIASTLAAAELDVPYLLAPSGPHRTGSTWNAVEAMGERPDDSAPDATDLVAVHDAARPFATQHLLRRLVEAAVASGGAVPGVSVPDTIVQIVRSDAAVGDEAEARAAASYLDRARLQAVQTPQVFRWELFHDAHRWCHENGASFTDDGGLLAARGHEPIVVMGEQDNWKITTETDWARAVAVLK